MANQTAAETTKPDTSRAGLPVAGLLLLAALSVVWGVNWPVMKIALNEIPVWWFRTACLIFGGVGLLTIAAMTGSRMVVSRSQIGALLLTAAFAVTGWHVFSGFGVSMMPAGRASIVAYTMPVWAALASVWLLGERLTALTILGLALGLAGLAVLMGPDLVALQEAPTGALLMLGSAVCWGFGTALFKRFAWTAPVVTVMGWSLILSAIPITTVAVLTSPMPDVTKLSEPALWSLAYVLLLPMTFGQWAYFQIVKLFPASIAALGTLAIPVVGVYSSALLLGEPAGERELIALGFICAALTMILLMPAIFRRRGKA